MLALIQGAAELLPVSSSAHVIVAERLMGLDPSRADMVFLLVMLHTGTMFAVLVYFWKRWRSIWLSTSTPAESTAGESRYHFLTMVILATAVTGIVGYGLKIFLEQVVLVRWMGRAKGEVEDLFREIPWVATALFAVGVLIIVAGWRKQRAERTKLTTVSTLLIGLVQAVCLPFRGFSRSGATISAALMCDVERARAEDFSFALAVVLTPPVIARGVYKLLKERALQSSGQVLELLQPGLVGMVFSFLAGLVALKLLSAVLEKGRWRYFGYYCIIAALLMAAGIASGVLDAPETNPSDADQVGVLNVVTSPVLPAPSELSRSE
ncbi:MAG TPA: undecaprenyl-diphosphate phosphatase [Gemmataceae bacterium]